LRHPTIVRLRIASSRLTTENPNKNAFTYQFSQLFYLPKSRNFRAAQYFTKRRFQNGKNAKLYQRLKSDSRRWLAVKMARNGTPQPHADVAGYALRYTENGERKMECVRTLEEAVVMLRRTNIRLYSASQGVVVPIVPAAAEQKETRLTMDAAVEKFLAEKKEHKRPKTHDAYVLALKYFRQGCRKQFVDEIGRDCMLNFSAALRREKYARETIHNLFQLVATFLKAHGREGIILDNDWPRYETKKAEIYSDGDVVLLLAACTSIEERALILLATGSGFRHAEISHCQVKDINWKEGTVSTRSKPEFDFCTKDFEQRTVPLSDNVLKVLKQHTAGMQESDLLFANRENRPDIHLDRVLRKIAKRAGVVVPSKPLHAMRALYATRLCRSEVDVYTIQSALGHSKIETTLSYLRSVKNSDPALRAQVNAASF
jgi:site-specific recombinase XerD